MLFATSSMIVISSVVILNLINVEHSMNVLTIKNGNAKIKMKIKLVER